MRFLYLTICLLFGNLLWAQNDVLVADYSSDSSARIGITGLGLFNSSAIPNDFITSFLLKKTLSKAKIQQTISYLEPQNNFGMDLIGRIDYLTKEMNRGDSSSMRWQFTYRSVIHSDFSINKNLFALIFQGNKQFAGKTVGLGNNSIQNISYDNLMFQGISKTVYQNSTHTLGIGGGLLLGTSINSAYFNNTTLYTEANGEYLDLNSAYNYYSSSNIPGYYKGFGINAMGFYLIEKEKEKIVFSFDNAGFINWKQGGTTFANDTTIHFEGVEIKDIFTNASALNQDSLIRSIIGSKSDSGAFTRPIIPEVCFAYERILNNNFSLESALRFRVNGNYKPNISGKIKYFCNEKLYFALLVGYGGYGFSNFSEKKEASFGFETAFILAKSWKIFLQAPFVNSMFNPKWLAGDGAIITISKKL